MASLIAPSPLSDFELQRLNRIAENRRRMEESGLLEAAKNLAKCMKPVISKPPTNRRPKERRHKTRHQPRRSGRLNGTPAEYGQIEGDDGAVTYSDYEPGLKDLLAGDAEIESLPEEKQVQFQEMRCASAAGRGSVYDSVAGITCHFCRQKKLCGEDGCPRCSRRSTTAECIGKSDCARCHSATGRFCRACLLIRYGQTLEDVREQMAAGTWLCPHCYEEEHPEEGWMCNSSICMKRRGFKPTGIAIYDAQQRGFPSVAHWLQAQLIKSNNNTSKAPAAAAAAASDKAVSSSGSNAASAVEEDEEDEVTAAGAAAGAATRTKGRAATKAAAAAAAAAAAELGSQESRQDSSTDNGDAAVAAAVAPGTPLKTCEGTPGPGTAAAAAAAAEGGAATRRTTRSAAAGGSSKEGGVVATAGAAAPSSKRACVGEFAGTRRSLRFRR